MFLTLSLKLRGFSHAAKVENYCTSHLYLRIVRSLPNLCIPKTFSKCLLNQSEFNVWYIATTPNGHIFLLLYLLHQKSQWLHGSRKSVCTCHLFTCNSGTLHRVISVSLSSPYLCGRVVLWSWPTRKQGDLGGQRGRKGKDKGNIANKQESDHET